MTAVPGSAGTALLFCDRCGAQDTGGDIGPDADLVWPAVLDLGWSGSPFATGTHLCTECSALDPPAPAPAAERPAGPAFTTRRYDGTAVITPVADLDAALAESLRDELRAAVTATPRVVVDLRWVRQLDSAGLGLLVRAHQEAKQAGHVLALAAPSRFVRTVLHTMRLDTVFTLYADVPA